MTRKIQELDGESFIVGNLPLGCKLCAMGSKMVLFVTGLCDSSCYYCPLSENRANLDVIYADEMLITDDDTLMDEVEAIDAQGAGISGGDPLCKMKRTLKFIRQLKTSKGDDFHIHLYTSKTDVSMESLLELKGAGLDEIRFHPQDDDWTGIERAIETGLHVGLEVPSIPGKTDNLIALVQRAEKIGASFVNLNELESSETNFEQLVSMGMRLTSLDKASIEGSKETAMDVLEWTSKNLESITVHFCSARYKDAVQLRNRLERRLERVIRPFEIRDDDDPLLILGIIRAPHGHQLIDEQLRTIMDTLLNTFEVPEELVKNDDTRHRIEIAPWILEEICQDLKDIYTQEFELEIGIANEYPTWDRLQTFFDPL
ncbi:MAG: radical SAM protein [Candidatus Thorarchaeota archaeon]